eukprot:scaffold219515_cov30-Tisochrysis_lutea.AAC.2
MLTQAFRPSLSRSGCSYLEYGIYVQRCGPDNGEKLHAAFDHGEFELEEAGHLNGATEGYLAVALCHHSLGPAPYAPPLTRRGPSWCPYSSCPRSGPACPAWRHSYLAGTPAASYDNSYSSSSGQESLPHPPGLSLARSRLRVVRRRERSR